MGILWHVVPGTQAYHSCYIVSVCIPISNLWWILLVPLARRTQCDRAHHVTRNSRLQMYRTFFASQCNLLPPGWLCTVWVAVLTPVAPAWLHKVGNGRTLSGFFDLYGFEHEQILKMQVGQTPSVDCRCLHQWLKHEDSNSKVSILRHMQTHRTCHQTALQACP